MKFKNIFILSLLAILFINIQIYAEEENVDMHDWAFVMLTDSSDQDENVVVSKYYLVKDKNQVGFCIEPEQRYNPSKKDYIKKKYDNEKVYQLVKAYKKLNKLDKEYFIATQLLIWEETNDIEYTFDGYDYYEYKQEILDLLENNKPLLKATKSNDIIESYYEDENTIENDYSDYDVDSIGVEIISNDKNGLKYKINEVEPTIKTLNFTPKDQDDNHSFVLESEQSQDIYYYEGEYSNLKPFSLNIMTLFKPSTFNINYSKKDEDGIPIKGAEFTVYDLNSDKNDDELVFIHKNAEINIYDALLADFNKYDNLSIELSERYTKYLNGNIFKSDEIGYFPYKIYNNGSLIKQGKAFISDDILQSTSTYSRIAAKRILSCFSGDSLINSINDLPTNKAYYLCETEPKKGYTYTQNACVLVDSNEYTGKTIDFINKTRKYTLKLVKHNAENILLNGAVFKISYNDFGIYKEVMLKTGSLYVERENNFKYLVYKHEKDDLINIIEFDSDIYIQDNLKEGKYFYYQTNDNIINSSLLNNNYTFVVNGGIKIENLPYSSSLTIEELQAPNGYIITEPIYHVDPDIPYSDITFRNYRINYLDILPKRKFKFPKTCIEN